MAVIILKSVDKSGFIRQMYMMGDIIMLIVKKDIILNFNNYLMKEIGTAQIIIFFIVFVIIFLIMREVNLWYFKINKKIELHEETNRLLKQLVDEKVKKNSITIPNNLSSDEETNVNDPEVLRKIISNLDNK